MSDETNDPGPDAPEPTQPTWEPPTPPATPTPPVTPTPPATPTSPAGWAAPTPEAPASAAAEPGAPAPVAPADDADVTQPAVRATPAAGGWSSAISSPEPEPTAPQPIVTPMTPPGQSPTPTPAPAAKAQRPTALIVALTVAVIGLIAFAALWFTTSGSLNDKKDELAATEQQLDETSADLDSTSSKLDSTEQDLSATKKDLDKSKKDAKGLQSDLKAAQRRVKNLENRVASGVEQQQALRQCSTDLNAFLEAWFDDAVSVEVAGEAFQKALFSCEDVGILLGE